MDARRFIDVITVCDTYASAHPENAGLVASVIGKAQQALENHEAALAAYQRAHDYTMADEAANRAAPGRPGHIKELSILHWCSGNTAEAVTLMQSLTDGILRRKINYGDAAGGVSQGLLLHYMGVALGESEIIADAVKYLRNRAKRSSIRSFPGHVARYLIDEIPLTEVMNEVERAQNTQSRDPAWEGLLGHRFLTVALFHDGVRKRAKGDHAGWAARMSEVIAIPNPLIEQEWYLARHEVQKASS